MLKLTTQAMRGTKLSFFTLLAFILCYSAAAQTDKLGGWELVNLSYRLSPHFSLYAEAQVRSQQLTNDFYYHEIKGGISYNVAKKFAVLLAMGDYRTHAFPGNFKELQTIEFRLWEQLSFNSNIDPLRIEHRYRIEQRWLNGDYRNRFRYRINPVLPINNKTLAPHTLYATAFNEVFFTNKAPYFERNRIFAGLGYQFSKFFTLQSGFIRQFDYRKADDGSGKNFIITSLLFSVDRTEDHTPKHPTTLD